MRKDAFELIRYARSKKLFVNMTTNALLLDEAKIDELLEAGLTHLIVSIDSPHAARHDELRRCKGLFKAATDALLLAGKKGLRARIWTYATRSNFNFHELDDIIKLGQDLGVDHVFVFFPLLSGHLYDRFEDNLTLEDREAFRERYNGRSGVVLELPSEKSPCRGGGYHHLCVMPSGDVTFCPPVPYSYGHIDSKSLKDCLLDIKADHKRFAFHATGQCPVNLPDYREHSRGEFMYDRSPSGRRRPSGAAKK